MPATRTHKLKAEAQHRASGLSPDAISRGNNARKAARHRQAKRGRITARLAAIAHRHDEAALAERAQLQRGLANLSEPARVPATAEA